MPNRARQIAEEVLAEHPAAERIGRGVDRHVSSWLLPSDDLPKGQVRIRKRASVGPLFFQDREGDHEVDTDFAPHSGPDFAMSAKWTGRGRLPIGSAIRPNAERRFTPRPEHPDQWVETGAPEWRNPAGTQWTPVPLGQPTITEDIAEWQGQGYAIEVVNRPHGVKAQIRLDDDTHAQKSWRWKLTLNNLTRIGRQLYAPDGEWVAQMVEPEWWDRIHIHTGPLPYALDGDYLVCDPPPVEDLAEAVYPVYLDPSYSDQVDVTADDGRAQTAGSFANNVTNIGNWSGDFMMTFYAFKAGLPPDASVSAATVTINAKDVFGGASTYYTDWYGVEETLHRAPTTWAEWNTDNGSLTTASTADDFSNYSSFPTEHVSPDLTDEIQELVDGEWVHDIGIHFNSASECTSGSLQGFYDYSTSTTLCAQLDVTYTSGYPVVIQLTAEDEAENSTTHTITSTSSPTSNNIIIAWTALMDADPGTLSASTGWTDIINDVQAATNDCGLWVGYDLATEATCTITADNAVSVWTGRMIEIGNCDYSTDLPDGTSAKATSSTNSDPPSHTSARSPSTSKILWLAFGAQSQLGNRTVTYPSGYNQYQTLDIKGYLGAYVHCAFAFDHKDAASENPAAFVYNVAGDASVAATVAVYAIDPDVTIDLSYSGNLTTVYSPSITHDIDLGYVNDIVTYYTPTIAHDINLSYFNSVVTYYTPGIGGGPIDLDYSGNLTTVYSPSLTHNINLGYTAYTDLMTFYAAGMSHDINLDYFNTVVTHYAPTVTLGLNLGYTAHTDLVTYYTPSVARLKTLTLPTTTGPWLPERGAHPRYNLMRFYGGRTVGRTVIITGGAATEHSNPSWDLIAAADAGSGEFGKAVFMGGRVYDRITAAEDTILSAAGYTVT